MVRCDAPDPHLAEIARREIGGAINRAAFGTEHQSSTVAGSESAGGGGDS